MIVGAGGRAEETDGGRGRRAGEQQHAKTAEPDKSHALDYGVSDADRSRYMIVSGGDYYKPREKRRGWMYGFKNSEVAIWKRPAKYVGPPPAL